MQFTDILLGILTLVVTIALGILTHSANRRTSDRAEIQQLRDERTESDRKIGVGRDYVEQLRKHIIDGDAPPPPPYPDGYFDK